MKKIISFLLSAVLAVTLCACSKDEENSKKDSSAPAEEVVEVDANELLMSMREAVVTFPQYTTASSHDDNGKEIDGWEDIFTLSLYENFDAEKIKSYAIAYSTVQTSDEITVVVLESADDAETMKNEMKARVKDRIATFETYGPEEVPKLESAKIVSKGNVCALIICDEPEKAAEAFKTMDN